MKSSETPVTRTEKYGESLTYDPEFRGPIKSRSCTDIICLFLFVAFLAGWAVVAYFAFREGDPRILLYPTDSDGKVCGIGELENKKYLFYFDLLKCASPAVLLNGCPTPQVCVERCPNETFYAPAKLKTDGEKIKSDLICKYNISNEKSVDQLLKDEDCASMYFSSSPVAENLVEDLPYGTRFKDVFVNRCIPDIFLKNLPDMPVKDKNNKEITVNEHKITVEEVKNATGTLAAYLSIREVGEKMFLDFKRSWKFIVLGLVISMLVSLIWIVLMRWVAGLMVWLSIIIVLAFSVFACYYSTNMYISLKGNPDSSHDKFKLTLKLKSYLALRDTWLAFAIISGCVFAILFLVILFLRKRIVIAIALIKEASRAVGCMITSLVFPFIPYLLMLVFFAFWITVALYIASSGKASFVVVDAPKNSKFANGTTCTPNEFSEEMRTKEGVKCLFQTYGLQNNLYSAHAYNLFGLFWGLFFAVGVGQISLAGAFAAYYWTLDKRHVPSCAVGVGFYRCIRYHLGSVAFGSLLIATVRFIRVILEYIDNKAKKYDNKFTKCLMWCLKCCFWCLEKLLRFISKNAYIMIAIYGKNFCTSARRAFMLLMRNIIRVVVLDKVTDFLLFMGKLVVVSFSAAASFYFFSTDQKVYKNIPQLHYNLLPPIFITLGSYIIASGFFSVYGMAVDTLFLCFLEDCERNDGSPEKPYYMSKELMKILDKRNKFKDPSQSSPSSPR